MPSFVFRDFTMHFEVIEKVLPHDTLFIHGNLGSNRWWQPTVETLRARYSGGKGDAILAEWRGCGQSSAPTTVEQLFMPNLANDYLQLLKHLNRTQVNVVGHSTGGLIALLAMAQEPQRFNRAVLLDSVLPQGVRFSDEKQAAFLRMSQDRKFCETVMQTTIEAVKVEDLFFQKLVDDAFQVAKLNWSGILQALSRDHSADLKQVKHPILFIQGEVDPVLPSNEARAFAQTWPNITYAEIPAHGHSFNIEDAERFALMIHEFLH